MRKLTDIQTCADTRRHTQTCALDTAGTRRHTQTHAGTRRHTQPLTRSHTHGADTRENSVHWFVHDLGRFAGLRSVGTV